MDLNELRATALREMKAHGLTGWTFALTDAKRQLGACKYRSKRIEIAEFYARNSPEETVLDTLRHEIAHALAGASARHGPKWKAVAVRLGATPRACESSPEVALQPGDWQATCPACGKTYHRYRRPQTGARYLCRCPARSPITFEFHGDPARKPDVPPSVESAANWEARCSGCGTVHLRVKRPKAGLWRCKCPHRRELSWTPRNPPAAR